MKKADTLDLSVMDDPVVICNTNLMLRMFEAEQTHY